MRFRSRQMVLTKPVLLAACLIAVLCGACRDGSSPEIEQQAQLPDSTSVELTTGIDSTVLARRDTIIVVDTLYVDTLFVQTPAPPATVRTDTTETEARFDAIEERLDRIATSIAALSTEQPQEARSDTISTASPRETLESAADNLSNFGLKFFVSLMFLFFTYFVIRIVVWILDTASERSASRRLFFKKLIPIVRIVAWSFIIYLIIAKVFNVDSQGLLAAGAALGVAVGFAAQDVLKNIFGGILIILDQPFQVGDKISVAGTYGEVVSIGLRSTRIVTPDDNLVSVPNTQVVDGQVANANAGALHCQVVTTLFLPGDVDVARAKKIAYEAAANSKYVYLDMPIVVLVKDHFEYRFLTKIVVKAYVLDTRYEFVFASEITETAKLEYLRQGLMDAYDDGTVYDERSGRTINGSPSEN